MNSRSLSVTAVLLLAGVLAPAGAAAADRAPRRAPGKLILVALGDSFASGLGGRWAGNAELESGVCGDTYCGTDRALSAQGDILLVQPGKIYGPSHGAFPPRMPVDDGCQRSDVSPVMTAARKPGKGGPVANPVRPYPRKLKVIAYNLSCTGARNEQVTDRASFSDPGPSGRVEGTRPQLTELKSVLHKLDPKRRLPVVVALSIGANELDFYGTILRCMAAWQADQTCAAAERTRLKASLPVMKAKTRNTVKVLETALAKRVHHLVLLSHPSLLPPVSEMAYPDGPARGVTGRCPFRDDDVAYFGSMASALDRALSEIAGGAGPAVSFLGLREAVRGHELCSGNVRRADHPGFAPPSPAESEWVVSVPDVSPLDPADTPEGFHLNAFGQRAAGHCLGLRIRAILKKRFKALGPAQCSLPLANGSGYGDLRLTRDR